MRLTIVAAVCCCCCCCCCCFGRRRCCCCRIVSSQGPTPVAPECTFCKSPIDPETSFPDMCARREVNALTVKCRESDQGCGWQGELLNYQAHFAICLYALVLCNLPDCTSSVQRRRLAEHQETECVGRHVACEHCGDDVIASRMSRHVAKECKLVKVPCPNSCGPDRFLHPEVPVHLKICPLEKVRCYYANSGCGFNDERQALAPHHDNNVAYHMQLIYQVADAAKRAVNELRQANFAMRQDVIDLKAKNTRLSNRVSELEASDEKVFKRMDSLEESQDKTNRLAERSYGASVSRYEGSQSQSAVGDILTPSSAAAVPARDGQYTKDMGKRIDTMERSLTVQDLQLSDLSIRQDLMEVKMSNGVLVWRISDVGRRLAEAESGRTPSLYSPPFYTSPAGYKMCARIYLNGDGSGKNTHISLFFVVMRGDFDALLPWPFQQRVKLSLMDQSPAGVSQQRHDAVEVFRPDVNSSSFQRPTSDMNIATGCPRFAPKELLHSSQYMMDNTIFLKVDVNISGVKGADWATMASPG